MNTKNPATWYSLGSRIEQDINSRSGGTCRYWETVLALGRPVYVNAVAGASFFAANSSGYATTHEIKNLASALAYGFVSSASAARRLGCHKLVLSLGTSNNGSNVTQSHGYDWGRMLLSTDIYLYQAGVLPYVIVLGASDMELAWNGPTTTKSWVTGLGQGIEFFGFHWSILTNFGDAAGCPQTGTSGNCDNGWTVATVSDISGGMGEWISAFPEIYRTDGATAREWAIIWCYTGCGNRTDIYGSLTQYQACRDNEGTTQACPSSLENTPATGWTQLHDEWCSRGGPCSSDNPHESLDIRHSLL